MKEDKNKGITEIKYNHLNLPTEIKFSNQQKIAYIYNALGTKIEKTVTNGSNISKTEYLDSFQYIDGELQFFPTSEGYVRKTDGTNRRWFDYVYNYTDHLGNIRLSYTTDPISGSTNNIKILEENNYYPFGLQHGSYNTPARDYRPIGDAREIETVDRNPYKYKYQGQERQDELNLNWDSFKWRNYDYALGRFMSVDPLAEDYMDWGPYVFSGNRVVDARELEGLEPVLLNGPDVNGLETWKIPVHNYQVTYNNKTGNYESKQVSTSYEYRIKSENKTNTWNGQSELSYTIVDKDNSIKQMSTAENGIEVAGQIQETYSPIDLGEVEATKKVGNSLEDVGSTITTISLASEIETLGLSTIGVGIGQGLSLTGSGINVFADLQRGDNESAGIKFGTTAISTSVGKKIDKATEGKAKTGWIRASYEQFSNWLDKKINE